MRAGRFSLDLLRVWARKEADKDTVRCDMRETVVRYRENLHAERGGEESMRCKVCREGRRKASKQICAAVGDNNRDGPWRMDLMLDWDMPSRRYGRGNTPSDAGFTSATYGRIFGTRRTSRVRLG